MINNEPQEIVDKLKSLKNPVQFIDSRIDMDALASAFAMAHLLKTHFGIHLTLCYEKTISERNIRQFDGFIEVPEINQNMNLKDYDFSQHDSMIFTDTGNIEHISELSDFVRPQGITLIDIDHHTGNPGYGDFNYVKELGSACTVIYDILKKTKIEPDKQLANALLMGIITDTGFYNYNSTTEDDFKYSAELLEYGAEHYKIIWQLTFNESIDDTLLKKLVFKNLRIDLKEKVAYSTITKAEIKEMNFDIDNSFVSPSDLIKKIQGIDCAFVVKELENNIFNVSIRGHSEKFNCVALAKMLNPKSGGHLMAAGANINAQNLDEAVQTVLETVKKFKSQENS